MRIGVAGIGGRIGRLLVDEIGQTGHVLAGGIGRARDGEATHDTIRLLADRSDIVIDFTHPDAVLGHAEAVVAAGIPWILGTTGLDAAGQQAVERASRRVPVVQASNFSPGVTLLAGLARRLAASLPADEYDAEILEMHHRQKIDAPSGTAISLGEAVASARGVKLRDVRESGRDGQVGARSPGAIGFAALRGGQIVGEHTLSFTSGAEQIAISHRAFDRRAFAAGAIRAASWALDRPAGLYDMEDVLGLR